MNSILSTTCKIDKKEVFNVESILEHKYGNIVRWAIVDIIDEDLIVSVSYKV